MEEEEGDEDVRDENPLEEGKEEGEKNGMWSHEREERIRWIGDAGVSRAILSSAKSKER